GGRDRTDHARRPAGHLAGRGVVDRSGARDGGEVEADGLNPRAVDGPGVADGGRDDLDGADRTGAGGGTAWRAADLGGAVGVGIDLVEVDRVAAALARTPRLADRVFTPDERHYCEAARHRAQRHQRYAARFAAKEA